ncbi:uncharacterized protein LOC135700455 [Ochlerotatus camptorhynchus]|uniref:uncharacterized protein LOC135700455 n=1 Tax=Ochlerotatus camptorhynchus TaxID=644619 RepID=UPI0031E248AF
MRSWVILIVSSALVAVSQAAIYPWIPFAPWWVRAPDKDTPAAVNIQQHGGNYHLSTVEGKAYHALAPAHVFQPPVTAVHVQAVPSASLQYLRNGQAILLLSPPTAPAGQQAVADGAPDAGTTAVEEEPTEPSNDADQDEPREPAPVTEQPEENEATEST